MQWAHILWNMVVHLKICMYYNKSQTCINACMQHIDIYYTLNYVLIASSELQASLIAFLVSSSN